MNDKFQNCREIFKDHELIIEFENENLRSYLCKRKDTNTYWFRVVCSPLLITVNGDFGNFIITPCSKDSFKWLLNTSKKDPYYILSKIPNQMKSSFYQLSREKVLIYLKELQEKCDRLNHFYRGRYVKKFIRILDYLTEEKIYKKCLRLNDDDPDKMPDINDYNFQSYFGVAALFKLDELYQEKIKVERDKFMFENFMTPAIAEYKNELI